MEDYNYDDFEDRFADELEDLADFESQQTLPVQSAVKKNIQTTLPAPAPPKSHPKRNVVEDFFSESQSSLAYPDDDEELEEVPVSRKRPTSGSTTKNSEKRRKIDDDDEDIENDAENQLIIDDSPSKNGSHRVFDALHGDVPNGSKNSLRDANVRRSTASLSSVLKNKGEPLRDRVSSNGEDRFTADRFKITREASSGVKSQTNILNGNDDERERATQLQNNLERRRILKHPPSTDDYVYLTEGDKGKRIYLAVKPEEAEVDDSTKLGFANDDGGGGRRGRQLLGVDFNALKRRVILEMEARETATRADEIEAMEDPDADEETGGQVEKHILWVEKYAPRGYTDLLSDDGMNRTLLKWLKLWDKLVFAKEIKLSKDKKCIAPIGGEQKFPSNENFVTKFGKIDGGRGKSGSGGADKSGYKRDSKGGYNGENKGGFKGDSKGGYNGENKEGFKGANKSDGWKNQANTNFKPDGKFFNSKFKDPGELVEEFDKLGRPEQKIVLISGPPGLGKTTLAHIVARHVGYAVQEMNASDDRSPEAFKNKIEAACQTKSVMGEDPRPNCLVIDEIDGATAPAINVLLNFLKAGMGGAGDSAEAGGIVAKKKSKMKPLLRPVICICNDLYAPSLRPLRPLALLLKVPPTDPSRLVARLLKVARREHLKTDQSTLMALCLKMENDIRGCLNTLQFIRGRYKELTLGLVKSSAVGLKDVHRNLYSVWQSIFQMPRAEKRAFTLDDRAPIGDGEALAGGSKTSLMTSRFKSALNLVQSAGETEKVLQGLFDNYLLAKIKDSRMVALNLAESWLITHDLINTKIQHTQNYVMMPYLYFTPVTFHMIFAMNHPPRIKYPNSEYDNYTKTTSNDQLLRLAMNDIHLKVRKWLTVPLLLTDVIPPLLEIIRPQLRPVNSQLYSAKEKAQIKTLIDNMLSFSLTYQQEKNDEGQYRYDLEPKIDKLVRYQNHAVSTPSATDGAVAVAPPRPAARQLTYAAKQMIARELEMEKMRRSDAVAASKVKASPAKRNPFASPLKTTPADAAKSPAGLLGREGKKNLFGPTKESDKSNDGENGESSSAKPKIQIKLSTPTAKSLKPVVFRDFFGRVLKSPSEEELAGKKVNENVVEKKKSKQKTESVWFCFKQGYSNAVRKPIKIRELL